jgi:hypothetical protein
MAARTINAAVALWLFFSAFLWPHTLPQLINAWTVGMLAVTVALTALSLAPRARYLNAVLGLWLIVSSIFWRDPNVATTINHVVVGAALVVFGLLRGIGHFPRHAEG